MESLIIVGDGEIAELANEYFLKDNKFNLIGHVVEKKFQTREKVNETKVFNLENIKKDFPPNEVKVFIGIGSNKLNFIRSKYYKMLKENGYKFASYISPKANIWDDVVIGENSFIFENNNIQKGCEIGNNVILWSGNHIGHRTKIKNHCFITSHCVISGYCLIDEYCYIGVNSTIIDNISIGEKCFINAGSLIKKNLNKHSIYNSDIGSISKVSTNKFFKI